MTLEFTPLQPGLESDELIRRLNDMLRNWSEELNTREPVEYLTQPQAPFNGMFFYADSTNWNPGSGTGVYTYFNGSYIKLS